MFTNQTRTRLIELAATIVFTMCAVASPAHAGAITDPANDFIPSFTGTHSGDIDVLSAFATYNGTTFHIGGTVNGTIGTLPTSLYVFGFNRGAAVSNFAAISAPGVIFDAVITLTGTGVLAGRDLVTNTALTLPAGAAHISGATFTIDVPATLLPSQGLSPQAYGVNLWPRDVSQVGLAAISDFAPDNAMFDVPEPLSSALFLSGLAGMALVRRRRAA